MRCRLPEPGSDVLMTLLPRGLNSRRARISSGLPITAPDADIPGAREGREPRLRTLIQ
jgi:hypothetical protein